MNWKTNRDYWNCECPEDFIHKTVNGNFCTGCKTWSEDCPHTQIQHLVSYQPSNDEKLEINL